MTTVVAAQEQWPSTLNAIGTMAAVRGVTVSADLAGIVDQILFDSGEAVREGQVLVILDTVEEMMLHQPQQFRQILDGFRAVHKECSGLRLVLSGRYPLKEVKEFELVEDPSAKGEAWSKFEERSVFGVPRTQP